MKIREKSMVIYPYKLVFVSGLFYQCLTTGKARDFSVNNYPLLLLKEGADNQYRLGKTYDELLYQITRPDINFLWLVFNKAISQVISVRKKLFCGLVHLFKYISL